MAWPSYWSIAEMSASSSIVCQSPVIWPYVGAGDGSARKELVHTVGIHEAVAAECTKELSASVDWPPAQGQTPEETISQGDRRV